MVKVVQMKLVHVVRERRDCGQDEDGVGPWLMADGEYVDVSDGE